MHHTRVVYGRHIYPGGVWEAHIPGCGREKEAYTRVWEREGGIYPGYERLMRRRKAFRTLRIVKNEAQRGLPDPKNSVKSVKRRLRTLGEDIPCYSRLFRGIPWLWKRTLCSGFKAGFTLFLTVLCSFLFFHTPLFPLFLTQTPRYSRLKPGYEAIIALLRC